MSDMSTNSTQLQSAIGDIVIGIPAYNEEETVAEIVQEALEFVESVVVVDDGSDDRTATRAEQAGATVIRHEENRGYGAALETIFETAYDNEVDHLVVVDGDGQHDPKNALELVATQRSSDAEIVIGSRFVGGSQTDTPLYRRVGLAVINFLVGMCLRFGYSSSRVYDTQSGFRAYDSTAIEMLAHRADLSDGMDASVDILFHAADENYEFAETPIEVTYDVVEANTHNPIVHGAVLVQNVFARILSDRPVRSLGIFGGVCLLPGAVLGATLVSGYSLTEALAPLFLAILIMAGGSLAGVALIGERSNLSND